VCGDAASFASLPSVFPSFHVIRKIMLKKEEPLIREHKAFAAYIETGDRHGLSTIEDSMITLDISSRKA
jgi:hypothetical protein